MSQTRSSFDQPGKLYVGREFDLDAGQPSGDPIFLGLRDLTTHAVCLGMTGTGKTGLGIVVLEEVLLQGVPCIIVDPKGDITNLALSFPRLQPADFRPWLDADEAARQGMTLDQFAAATADKWRAGLAQWGIGPERIATLRDRVTFDIYTPGSDAGIPVNVLQSLAPPDDPSLTWAKNTEALRERIAQVVQAILSLAGVEADPLKSREHILLATIFEASWRAGQPLDIASLIRQIQDPPIRRVGAFDMDVFYPRSERFQLAMALNNLVASPSFAAWTQGAPLDIAGMIAPDRSAGGTNPAGKTRAAIFYLAHLGEAERQFFVALLLSQLVLWMRAQTGTSSLRALVYFDEVFGYAPPFPRNPPTKTPLMTIVKQGRAAGLGAFLATQNPADLDYKGLANIGTWFIGRLRTGRDRDRALEGLEGAGAGFDRAHFESPLSTLPPRVFLLQSATGDPRFFHSRWAMSFLRGPLTRDQVAALAGKDESDVLRTPYAVFGGAPERGDFVDAASVAPGASRPSLPPGVNEVFLHDNKRTQDAGRHTRYIPHLLASASVRITDRASGVNHDERYTFLLPLDAAAYALDFTQARMAPELSPAAFAREPVPGAQFAPLPPGIDARWMKRAERALVEHIYRHGATSILFNRTLKVYGQPGETQLDFRRRCEAIARERRDAEALKLHDQFDRRMQALQDKLAREHRELESDRVELSARKREELLGGVESLFNLIVGRRQSYAVAFGARRRREVESAEREVRESEEAIAKLNADLEALAQDYKAALSQLSDKWMRALSDVVEVPLAPKKSDIFVNLVAIAWAPEG
ncbi:MAG: ATP-binding protein [Anaerolineae bacterium]|nr:ATP-binding protein [Candidatus Roseilinea sp.]MDW8448585.1 ATP-binding protein [Anaerolineae bacterium]